MSAHEKTITIPGHIQGYPGVAFGGYVAGMLAQRVGGDSVRVNFRRPIPVETPVLLLETASGATLSDAAGTVLAEALHDTDAGLTIPEPPSMAEAKAASAKAASVRQPMPYCYGCGNACPPGRGLRLYPWGVRERNQVAAAWIPDHELADADGRLPVAGIWSALDCPGGGVAIAVSGMAPGAVTAAMRVTRYQPVSAGEEYLVHAWPIATQGRKYTVGVALSTPEGTPCATAEALWIEPRE